MNNKKIIIMTSVIISIILVISIIISLVISNHNKNMKQKPLYVVIYQYHTSDDKKLEEPIIIYKERFTKHLTYETIIYALDNSSDYNHIIIENGKIIVSEANCKEQVCVHTIIDLNNDSISLVNPNTTTIECKPHGLKITLEAIE